MFHALGVTRVACFLGELFCRRPILPDPAPPHRRAPRPGPPVVCPGFGLDQVVISAFRCSPHVPGIRLAALMRASTSTTDVYVEVANGDIDFAVDKLGEVQKMSGV